MTNYFNIKIEKDLEIRLPDKKYAEELFKLIDQNREELRTWFTWVDKTTEVKNSEGFLDHCRKQWAEKKDHDGLMIFFDNNLVGSIGFKLKNDHKAEIGYWLTPDARGKGVISKSVQAMLDVGFNHLGVNRIIIRAARANVASQNVAKRNGFTEEGLLRQDFKDSDGNFHDSYQYSILKSEWDRKRRG